MLNNTQGVVFDAHGREIAPGAPLVHRDHAPAETEAPVEPPSTGGLVTDGAVAITQMDEAQAIAFVGTVEDGDVLRELANLVAPDAVKEAAAARLAELVQAAEAEAKALADKTAADAVTALKDVQNKDLLRILADSDTRATVKDAASKRLAALEKATRG